jgi:formate hydrogenlyase subunit 4/hydrogenase-4 membrane subunit HyfE
MERVLAMPYVSDWLLQVLQVGTVLGLGPLVSGAIARAEAIIQGRRGPRLLQPYHDIVKLLRKETVVPDGAGPVFRAAPYVSFGAYCTVPLLIPVLTSFPLELGYMADILGGGFILAMASFAVSLAAIDSGSPFAQLGSSRVRTFGALGEPTVIFVVFTVAFITHTDLPYALADTLRHSAAEVARPSHLLAAAALFMVILAETGRVPLESHGGTLEFGLIEEGRTFEHSGPGLALLRWGSSAKQLILFTILMNVFLVPWGLADDARLDHVLEAMALLLAKAAALGGVIVLIECSYAKLRLYRIPEFTVAGFLLSVLAVTVFILERPLGIEEPTVFGGIASVVAVGVLLLTFAMLRAQEARDQLRLYGVGSALVAIVAIAAAAHADEPDLYVIGAVTIAFKALAIPAAVGVIIHRLDVPTRIPAPLRPPTLVLAGIVLSAFGFLAVSQLPIDAGGHLPLSALATAVAVMLVAFLLMIARPYAPSQLLGFLVLENAVTLASLVLAPSLPLILALLLLFDVFIGLVVFVVLLQYFGVTRTAVTTDVLDRLRG